MVRGRICYLLIFVWKTLLSKFLFINMAALANPSSDFSNSSVSDKIIYQPEKNYFLPYMLLLKENFYSETYSSLSTCERQFLQECAKKTNEIFFFNQIVYQVVCKNISNDLLNCNYNLYDSKSQSVFSCNSTACKMLKNFVYTYIKAEKNLHFPGRVKQNSSDSILVYNEVVMEDVPFCFSISCPSLVDNYRNVSLRLSALDSMPPWCRCGFYFVFAFDILLSFVVAISNGTIIYIGLKDSFVQFPWG